MPRPRRKSREELEADVKRLDRENTLVVKLLQDFVRKERPDAVTKIKEDGDTFEGRLFAATGPEGGRVLVLFTSGTVKDQKPSLGWFLLDDMPSDKDFSRPEMSLRLIADRFRIERGRLLGRERVNAEDRQKAISAFEGGLLDKTIVINGGPS